MRLEIPTKGSLFYNSFQYGILFPISDIDLINYADENTTYVATDNIENVITKVKNNLIKLSKLLF